MSNKLNDIKDTAQAYVLHDILSNKKQQDEQDGVPSRNQVEWILGVTEILGRISTSIFKRDAKAYQAHLTMLGVYVFRWMEKEYIYSLEHPETEESDDGTTDNS